MHPASLYAIETFWAALAVERLSLGIVRKSNDGGRGYASWLAGLTYAEFMASLPRAAAANVAGSHIYVRLHSPIADRHPGILLLDDLDQAALFQLREHGFEPTAVVETSSRNFQAWVRLIPVGEHIAHSAAQAALRLLIERFRADTRACSPTQPGRLPGYTNRKAAYVCRGRYPFVRLVSATTGLVAPSASSVLTMAEEAQPTAPRAAPRKTPQAAVGASGDTRELDRLRDYARRRIADQLRVGQRTPERASDSEIDWMAVCLAIRAGWSPPTVEAWLQNARPERDREYAMRTVSRALDRVLGATGFRP